MRRGSAFSLLMGGLLIAELAATPAPAPPERVRTTGFSYDAPLRYRSELGAARLRDLDNHVDAVKREFWGPDSSSLRHRSELGAANQVRALREGIELRQPNFTDRTVPGLTLGAPHYHLPPALIVSPNPLLDRSAIESLMSHKTDQPGLIQTLEAPDRLFERTPNPRLDELTKTWAEHRGLEGER